MHVAKKKKLCIYTVAWNKTLELKTIPFTIATQDTESLGINLTKDMQDLYTENNSQNISSGNSLVVQWLELLAFIMGHGFHSGLGN